MKATLISGCHTRAREPIGQRDVQEYFAHVNFKGTSKTLAGTSYYYFDFFYIVAGSVYQKF